MEHDDWNDRFPHHEKGAYPGFFLRRLVFVRLRQMRFLLCYILIVLGGCTAKYGSRGAPHVAFLAQKHDFILTTFNTAQYDLFGAIKVRDPRRLHVYIEGDGVAWIFRTRIASDPTPKPVTGFALAAADQSGASVVYLARPGHFIQDGKTTRHEWTYQRYSLRVMATYHAILEQLSQQFPHADLSLLGYSGGGAIALMMAGQHDKIPGTLTLKRVVTFAGMLDHHAWSAALKLTPLTLALNPPDFAASLSCIPQIHFVGEKDAIVPLSVTQSYMRSLQRENQATVITVPEQNHWDNWDAFWGAYQKMHQDTLFMLAR